MFTPRITTSAIVANKLACVDYNGYICVSGKVRETPGSGDAEYFIWGSAVIFRGGGPIVVEKEVRAEELNFWYKLES